MRAVLAKIMKAIAKAMKSLKKMMKKAKKNAWAFLFGSNGMPGAPEADDDPEDELEQEDTMEAAPEPEMGLDAEGLKLEDRYKADLIRKFANTPDHDKRLEIVGKLNSQSPRLGEWLYKRNEDELGRLAAASDMQIRDHLSGASGLAIPGVSALPLFGKIPESQPRIDVSSLQPQRRVAGSRYDAIGFDGPDFSGPMIDLQPNQPSGPSHGGMSMEVSNAFQPKPNFGDRIAFRQSHTGSFEPANDDRFRFTHLKDREASMERFNAEFGQSREREYTNVIPLPKPPHREDRLH